MVRLKPTSSIIVDVPFLVGTAALLLFGIIMVYDASVVYAYTVFGGKYHFLLLQAAWVVLGGFFATITTLLDYHIYPRFSFPILMGSIALLILVFVPGIGVEIYGANRWLSVGPLTIQSSEVMKLALILYLSSWFSSDIVLRKKLALSKRHSLLSFSFLLLFIVSLIIAEPDFGTAAIISGVGIAIYFASGAPLRHFIVTLPIVLVLGFLFIYGSTYRKQRLETFLNPQAADPLTTGYHMNQIKIALGTGGLFGRGIGQSRQKYEFLPEVCADSIFAVVGEELGFVGSIALILLFLFIVQRGFRIAKRAPDELGRLLATGVTSWLAIQFLINLSAMAALIPLTGVTLPLVSCGGSSMVVTLSAIGILLSVSKQGVKK